MQSSSRKPILIHSILSSIDEVFILFLSRHRRKLGDSDLDTAWHSAIVRLGMYLALPTATAVFLIFVLIKLQANIETSREYALWGQVVAAISVVVLGLMLERRFKQYLLIPPPLASTESDKDKRKLIQFRLVTIGVFLTASLLAIAMHELGLGS